MNHTFFRMLKAIIVATAIATALFILMNMASLCLGAPPKRHTAPHRPAPSAGGGTYWHRPSDTWRYNMGGISWRKSSKTWHHDGGAYPDTNDPGKERAYLQLEDPEGVHKRTKGHD